MLLSNTKYLIYATVTTLAVAGYPLKAVTIPAIIDIIINNKKLNQFTSSKV